MRYAWAGVVAAAVLSSVSLVPRTARACSCPSAWATVVWPLDGATEVARDTPLVVSHYDSSQMPVSFGYTLVRADGSEIPLSELERLPAAFEGCGASDTVFLRPSELLDEGAEYTLSLSGLPPDNPPRQATFTVGAVMFTPEPLQDVDIDYLHVEGRTQCYSATCGIAELRVDLGAPIQQPRWLVVESAAVMHGKNAFMFNDFDRQWRLSVELPGGDRCVQIRLYGLDGAKLLDERRCEPDRCALSSLRVGSDCGLPRGSGVDAARIPDGSCENPPLIEWAEGVGLVYPEPEVSGDEEEADAPPEARAGGSAPQVDGDQNAGAGNDVGADGRDQSEAGSSGCSAARPSAGAATAAGPWLMLALVALRRALRRQRLVDAPASRS